jgi:hypothetical protein
VSVKKTTKQTQLRLLLPPPTLHKTSLLQRLSYDPMPIYFEANCSMPRPELHSEPASPQSHSLPEIQVQFLKNIFDNFSFRSSLSTMDMLPSIAESFSLFAHLLSPLPVTFHMKKYSSSTTTKKRTPCLDDVGRRLVHFKICLALFHMSKIGV